MARFAFNPRRMEMHTSDRTALAQRTLTALDLADADDAPQGPGWFDSSWELVRGLEVREGPLILNE